jgi:hypothetical protein
LAAVPLKDGLFVSFDVIKYLAKESFEREGNEFGQKQRFNYLNKLSRAAHIFIASSTCNAFYYFVIYCYRENIRA